VVKLENMTMQNFKPRDKLLLESISKESATAKKIVRDFVV